MKVISCLQLGSILKLPHFIDVIYKSNSLYSKIWQNLKTNALLISKILDKGFSTCSIISNLKASLSWKYLLYIQNIGFYQLEKLSLMQWLKKSFPSKSKFCANFRPLQSWILGKIKFRMYIIILVIIIMVSREDLSFWHNFFFFNLVLSFTLLNFHRKHLAISEI